MRGDPLSEMENVSDLEVPVRRPDFVCLSSLYKSLEAAWPGLEFVRRHLVLRVFQVLPKSGGLFQFPMLKESIGVHDAKQVENLAAVSSHCL